MTTDPSAIPELAAIVAQFMQALARTGHSQNDQPEPRPIPERVLLTVEEAAERLRIGRTVMWRLIRNNQIDSVHIGRLRRIPVAAVDEYARRLVAEQSGKTAA
ncbi:MAG: helix-turn-helix domain-containing protein [Kutzneria sp.]|nr:helix-turn-helix domain-containing protein [Kutzneria sp.]